MTFNAIENGLFSLPLPCLTPPLGEPVRISG